MKHLGLYAVIALLLAGCGMAGNGSDSTKLRAKAEQEASTDVQNKNQAQKAARMEADLKRKHAYYGAVAGTYEGEMATNDGQFRVRITLVPSLYAYTGTRTREIAEIESDLINLVLNGKIIQWHPDSANSGVPCSVSGIRPNMDAGYITVVSNECRNLYQIYLADAATQKTEDAGDGELAKSISNQIQDGTITKVTRLRGTLQPSTSASTYQFDTRRTE